MDKLQRYACRKLSGKPRRQFSRRRKGSTPLYFESEVPLLAAGHSESLKHKSSPPSTARSVDKPTMARILRGTDEARDSGPVEKRERSAVQAGSDRTGVLKDDDIPDNLKSFKQLAASDIEGMFDWAQDIKAKQKKGRKSSQARVED